MSLLNIQVKIHTYIYLYNIISYKVKVYLKYSLLNNTSFGTFRVNTG